MEVAALERQGKKDAARPTGNPPVRAADFGAGPGSPVQLLRNLQHSHGNRYVQRFLSQAVLQRSCACAGGGSSCCPETAAEEVPPFIQTKLTVSQPGDQYEQEAERVAEQVMRAPVDGADISRYSAPGGIHHIGRQEADDQQVPAPEEQFSVDSLLSLQEIPGASHEMEPNLEDRILGIRGGGHPLSPDLRAFFEPRFGVDFSSVRIHTDPAAAQTAQRVGARAYTLGSDVAFAPGEYEGDSQEGRRLLAHELTHVVQQGNAVRTLMRACDCKTRGGTAPSSAQHSFLSAAFPNLKAGDYCVTGPATPTYNCFAWSIGNTSKWIDTDVDSVYGNKNGALEFSDFDTYYMFNGGLKPVLNATPADPQVALYANGTTPTHAARKTGSGDCRMESKLGANVRIVHDAWSLEGGSVYGNIARYYV